MMRRAVTLLVRQPRHFFWKLKVKSLYYWCRFFAKFPFYVQGKMDIESASLWHNTEFVRTTGGFFIPGDRVTRQLVDLDPWDQTRRDMMLLLLRSVVERAIPGALVELGVYRGATARLIHHFVPERKLYLFDTFSGFDSRDVEAERRSTGLDTDRENFSDTNVRWVLRNIGPLNDNIEVFPGFFPNSVPEKLRREQFAFVHLDADLYNPIHAGLEFFYERTVAGGFILVHDFNSWPGARKAVLDFLRNKPEIAIPMPDKSGSALIVKSGDRI